MLSSAVFSIDPAEYCAVIEDFIRTKLGELRREGIVVAISGGLDSSLVAALSVRAVGRERVLGLMLPVAFGNPEARAYGKLIASRLRIDSMTMRMSPILRGLGTSSPFLALVSGRERWRGPVERHLLRRGASTSENYQKSLRGLLDPGLRRNVARFASINRARVLAAYKVAEERNLMVAGSAHRTEDMLGLFVKYGIDDCADIMPIKNLYRSQSLQLARHIGLPGEILERPPNPDIIPGVTDKYASYFGLDSAMIDLVLYGIGEGMASGEIARELAIEARQVESIRETIALTEQCRNHAQAPLF